MAWIVADSFDYYGAAADVARSVWDTVAAPASFATGANTRFGVGQAINLSSTVSLQKTVASNEATLFLAVAYYRPAALSGTNAESYWQLRDGATAQCTVVFESSGNIVLKSGTQTGTVLATYTGAFAQDVWTHFQIRVVISNTAGSMTVRKNGQTSDTYASATNLNTRGGTANNYANSVVFAGFLSVSQRADDLLMYSGTAPAPNDWVGDVRAVCLPPVADTAQKQFTPSVATAVFGAATAVGTVPMTANTLRVIGPFVLIRSGTLTKLTVNFSVAMTGHAKAALYDSDGASGTPGTLLATSSEVTNPVSGLVDFAIPGGPALVAGHSYFLALLGDAACTPTNYSGAATGYTVAQSYATGFPNPAGTLTTTGQTPFVNGTCSGNVVAVSEQLANGDTDYVFDAVVGDADLYDVADLTVTPAAIVGVVSKIYVKKSDAGARNGQLLLSSGGTQVAGADTPLPTTYTYLARVDAVDPATGVAWTLAALNAVKLGQKVTA